MTLRNDTRMSIKNTELRKYYLLRNLCLLMFTVMRPKQLLPW